MTDKPDIIEFAEEVCGCELTDWEKELLRVIHNAGPDAKLVYPRMFGYSRYKNLARATTDILKGE